jgi:hypothetical protein
VAYFKLIFWHVAYLVGGETRQAFFQHDAFAYRHFEQPQMLSLFVVMQLVTHIMMHLVAEHPFPLDMYHVRRTLYLTKHCTMKAYWGHGV